MKCREDFRRTMEINVMGTIVSPSDRDLPVRRPLTRICLFAQLAVRAAMNSWVDCGGSMVIITSTAGQRGSDIYSACETRAIAPSDLPAR